MKQNPYIAGNPVGGGTAFVGRADVLRDVVRVLANPNENALVLYGQRRIGKTSVLQELAARLPAEGAYCPVYYDLQYKASLPLAQVVEELAARVAGELGQSPLAPWGENAPRAFQDDFLPRVLAGLPAATSIVLLFDEFDVLDSPAETQAGFAFFPYLRDLLSLDPQRLQFVFVIGRRPEDLSSLTLSVFKGVKSRHISLLSVEETAELVRLAERNDSLRWTQAAVTRIYDLAGGHPFLTQQLCQEIWECTYQDNPPEPPTIQPGEVEAAIPAVLRSATNALEWLWDGLGPAERVVASALAEAGPQAITQEELNRRLLESGVRILIGELQDAPRILQEWDLIEPADGGYHFRVELLRRWIADRKRLDRVQEEIDRVHPLADDLFKAAYGYYRGGHLEEAIPLFRRAVGLNPSHLRANQLLAEILLAQGEVTEARQLLESLYQYQPAAARPRLIQALLLQAQSARDENEQLALYEQVLGLEPSQPEAGTGKQRIWEERGNIAQAEGKLDEALHAYRQIDMVEKIEAVEAELRRRRLETGLQEIARLEQEEKYSDALALARQLHKEYPEGQGRLPDLELLKRKTHLNNLYRKALTALERGDRQEAQGLLVQIVTLEPRYKEATRFLHLAVQDVDVANLQAQLQKEKETSRKAEATAQQEAEACREREAEVEELRGKVRALEKHFEVLYGQEEEARKQLREALISADLDHAQAVQPTEIKKQSAGSRRPAASLVVRQGARAGTVFPLTTDSVVLGREGEADISLRDPEINRQHARISWQAGTYVLEDLDSVNGTFLNGMQITGQRPLRPGDSIGMGQTILVLQPQTMAEPVAPAVSTSEPSRTQPAQSTVVKRQSVVNPLLRRPAASLVVRQGVRKGGVFPLTSDSVVLGREEGVDISLHDPETSRQHARISWQAGTYVLEDLGSTNGTFLNGMQITGQRPLRPGDSIGMGQTILVLQPQAMAEPVPSAVSASRVMAEEESISKPSTKRDLMISLGCLGLLLILLVTLAVLYSQLIQSLGGQIILLIRSLLRL